MKKALILFLVSLVLMIVGIISCFNLVPADGAIEIIAAVGFLLTSFATAWRAFRGDQS